MTDELELERESISGVRIGIVHYGERIPTDDGYLPGRMGLVAEWLTEAGAEVTRFVPTFSQFVVEPRPIELSGSTSLQGTVELIKTRAYGESVGADRLGHLRDFVRGTASRISELPRFDVMLVGYPPPGIVRSVHRATAGKVPILVDIRDLWPDALAPSGSRVAARVAKALGTGLAAELLLADGVVAMSPVMLDRAPRSRRLEPITNCVSEAMAVPEETAMALNGPLKVVFVGSFTQGVDFESLLSGWRLFQERRSPSYGPSPTLEICGTGVRAAEVKRLTVGLEDSVDLAGWVPMTQIPEKLARADVGVVPTREGFGTTLNNKMLEYLASGLFVVNTLNGGVSDDIVELGLSKRVDPAPQGWADGFALTENDLNSIRDQRAQRIAIARRHFGRPRIERAWLLAISSVRRGPCQDEVDAAT
jgi:glycosyltransferase involved in cell wall biosynthesis